VNYTRQQPKRRVYARIGHECQTTQVRHRFVVPLEREPGRETGSPPPSYLDSMRDSSLEEGLRRRSRTWRILLQRPARRSVRIRDAMKRSSDAASGRNPSTNEDEGELVLLLQLIRMST
jgi:hypothetical protein